MKTMNFKGLMLLTFLIATCLSLPIMVLGQEEDDVEETDEYGAFENYHGGFGGIFRDNLGYGGNLIGTLFEMLLLDGLDLKNHEELESVYVLSADKEEVYEGNYSFAEQGDSVSIHYLPFFNSTGGNVSQYRTDSLQGYAYCVVEKEGGFNYNLTVGAALTLIIWDYDKSFIIAAQKVLDWAARFREAEKKDNVNQKIVAEGVQVLSWLIVHINEIFTGDELFVINPIVWQTLDMDPWNDFNIKKNWYDTGTDFEINIGSDINLTEDESDPGELLDEWYTAALLTKDSYMQWLLEEFDNNKLMRTLWTQFSFDLAQLWMKKFYVEIDLEELSKGEDAKVKKAFKGCDIEFYLFTHHLAGVFLYNDYNDDKRMTFKYEDALNETGQPIYVNNTRVQVPTSSEVTHRLILGSVEDFNFKKPKVSEKDQKVEWGLELKNVNMSAVPVFVDLNSYMAAPQEKLERIFFGLEFEIDMEEPNNKGEIEANGEVKLETEWAQWNNNSSPKPNANIDGLDMAIIYVSSILHFELNMKSRDDDPDDPDDDLLEDDDYREDEHTLKIGNYLDEDEKSLEFVDIAGPGYTLYNSSAEIPYSANTSIIPIALWEGEHKSRNVDPEDQDDTDDDFATDINAEAQWNVMFYAVCYPDFKGSGMGIRHDPTFSVYMVFTPESAGFWALILLIAGVGLAGVAAIIIKKKKEGFF